MGGRGGPGGGSKPVGHMWFIMPVIGFDFASVAFLFFFPPSSRPLIKGLCRGTTLLVLAEGKAAAATSTESEKKE